MLAAAAIVLPFATTLLNLYSDWLFFDETGFSSVFTTALYAKAGVGLFFGVLLLIVLLINIFHANRAHFPHTGIFVVGGGNFPRKKVGLERVRSELLRRDRAARGEIDCRIDVRLGVLDKDVG